LSSSITGQLYPTKVVVEVIFLTPNGSHAYYTITYIIYWEMYIPNLLVFLILSEGKN